MKIPEGVPWRSTGITLGSGGQGVVQVVTHKSEAGGPKYALKALRNVKSSQALNRFHREIEAVKKLNHAAIVQIIDQSKPADEFQFYVMEYQEDANTLAKIIFSDSNPFHGSVLLCLELFEQIVSAISACEASTPQIVHRDIKPENILVLPDRTIRLIDFGICQIHDGEMITLVDEDVGTRNYTSPECEAGNDADIGVHSDMYSAAKVLWSMITSQRAFAREAPVFGVKSMQEMFPAKPETWHLTRVFEMTIRGNPNDRFAKTAPLLDRIRDLRYIIQGRFPPLKEVGKCCPSCGWMELMEVAQGHVIFGNPNPPGIVSRECRYCGFVFVRRIETLQQNIKRLENLS